MIIAKGSIKQFITLLVLILSVTVTADTDAASKKRPLTHNDYDSWKRIQGTDISTNGSWLLYLEVPQDGEADLIVKDLQSNKEYRHTIGYSGEGTDSERAAKAQFSYDASHVAFLISPSQAEVKKYKKAKKKKKTKDKDKPLKRLGIMSLADGKVTTVERVKSFKMPKEAGGWLAYLKEAPPKPEKKKEDKDKKEKEEKGKSEELKEKKVEKKKKARRKKREKKKKKIKRKRKRRKKRNTAPNSSCTLLRTVSKKFLKMSCLITLLRMDKIFFTSFQARKSRRVTVFTG
ncbi:hypothetical protein ACFLRB_04610 [Acidobacteriota bacterium]